ncbi:MAG: hypothetical protein RJA69_1810 [Pseudomonadota bacterium]
MRLVLLGQPGDAGAAVAAQLAASLDGSAELAWCDTPEHTPAWSTLEAHDLVLLIEQTHAAPVDWRALLMSAGQNFQVIHPSPEGLQQELQWALGHHLHRTTGHSPWPLRSEIAQRWAGVCEKCSDPECEHRLFRRLVSP